MVIDILVWRLLHENHHELIIKHKRRLRKVVGWPKREDSNLYQILGFILDYDEKYGMCPPNEKSLFEFCKLGENFDNNRTFSTALHTELQELNLDESRVKGMSDMNVLIDRVHNDARKDWMLFTGDTFGGIVQAPPAKVDAKGKRKDPSGCDDAKRFLLRAMTDDSLTNEDVVAGPLHEHVGDVADSLERRLLADSTFRRMKTGFPHVDNNIIISKDALKFIGIAGMSGDGKTTIMNTIVYNWLKQGFNGLYVSFEHSALELYEFMAFLHSSHEDYADEVGPKFPSLAEWDLSRDPTAGVKVEQQHIDLMMQILRDIKSRKNLPGLLDVQPSSSVSTFEGLVAHLETFHEKNEYDFVVVDYLARLDVGGDARFREKEIENSIHKAQYLTRYFDGGKGIVLVTPMQVNREANKNAKRSADDKGKDEASSTFYDINAIANFSAYQHDMDYIFSVYSDENLKSDFKMVMETLKLRKGKRPSLQYMAINKSSGRVAPTVEVGKTESRPAIMEESGSAKPTEEKSDIIDKDGE